MDIFLAKLLKILGHALILAGGGFLWHEIDNDVKNFTIIYAINKTFINDFENAKKYECKVGEFSNWSNCEVLLIGTKNQYITINNNISEAAKKENNTFRIKIFDSEISSIENKNIFVKTKYVEDHKSSRELKLNGIFHRNYKNKFAQKAIAKTRYLLFKSTVTETITSLGNWQMKINDGIYKSSFANILPLDCSELSTNNKLDLQILQISQLPAMSTQLIKDKYYLMAVASSDINDSYEIKWTSTKTKNDDQKSLLINAKPVIYIQSSLKVFVI